MEIENSDSTTATNTETVEEVHSTDDDSGSSNNTLTYEQRLASIREKHRKFAEVESEFVESAKVEIPELCEALFEKVHEANPEETEEALRKTVREQVEEACKEFWKVKTIRDALPDEYKDPEMVRRGKSKKNTNIRNEVSAVDPQPVGDVPADSIAAELYNTMNNSGQEEDEQQQVVAAVGAGGETITDLEHVDGDDNGYQNLELQESSDDDSRNDAEGDHAESVGHTESRHHQKSSAAVQMPAEGSFEASILNENMELQKEVKDLHQEIERLNKPFQDKATLVVKSESIPVIVHVNPQSKSVAHVDVDEETLHKREGD